MKNLRLFWKIVRRCNAEKFTIGFFISFFVVSLIIFFVEPGITSYGDAMWYTFVSCTTIGFGDVVVTTVLSKILTVFMTLYELIWVAILSGVVVTNYLEVVDRREKLTATKFLDKLEHLTELDERELKDIQEKVVEFKKKM